MTNDIVVIGSGGHAMSVTNVALSCGYTVISYVDDCQAGKKRQKPAIEFPACCSGRRFP